MGDLVRMVNKKTEKERDSVCVCVCMCLAVCECASDEFVDSLEFWIDDSISVSMAACSNSI